MRIRTFTLLSLLAISVMVSGQEGADINKTDLKGLKQGHWIKKYPNGKTEYEGIFCDNHPVGEFRRYNEDGTLKSVLIYSLDGRQVDASIYHTNGYISSRGRYVNQLKEGKWKFYSAFMNEYLICEEEYSRNIKNGVSFRYYPDKTIAQKANFANGKKDGEFLQYHENGKLLLKTNYSKGKLNGTFEAWDSIGKPRISGAYKNDLRDGKWKIFAHNGRLRYEINYVSGITSDHQMEIDASHLIDSLEMNRNKVDDPEKPGRTRHD